MEIREHKKETIRKLYIKDGRQVISVTKYYVVDGKEEEIMILRGFYASDNYDPRDFGLESNILACSSVASTISQSSVDDNDSPHS